MTIHADRIKPDSFGITTYLESLLPPRSAYQVPTFQREVVWDRDRVKRLWDSICKFYPLGSILVWRTTTQLHSHRQIGGHPLPPKSEGTEFQYLLDGQQRTTALLTSVCGGKIEGDERDPHLYVDLSIEDSQEIDDTAWRERYLFWDEIDDRGGHLLRNAGRQQRYDRGLIVRLEDVARRFPDLEGRLVEAGYTDYSHLVRERLREVKQVFDNYKLSFIELRGIEVSEVCQIFERINQAGQPLNMFDIVVAKTYRLETDNTPGFYLRGLFDTLRHELETAGSQYASVDNTTLLQMLAVLVRESIPDAGIYNITDANLNRLRTEHLEAVWSDGVTAIRKVFDFFDSHLHLRGPHLIPYRYFFLSLSTYFFRNKAPDYGLLSKYVWYYSFHNEDLLSNTSHLMNHIERLRRARNGEEYEFDRFLLDNDSLRNTTYSSRGRLSSAVLALLANQDPRDCAFTNRSVLSSVYYSLTDHPNLHHIFPLDFCEKHLGEAGRYRDSLMNIAYLTQITNLAISNKNPVEYLREYLGQFTELERTHLLPRELADWARAEAAPDEALNIFVERRIDLLLAKLREYLPGVRIEIIDTRSELASAS